MKLFKPQETTGIFRILVRYTAEVVIIFIGITISFVFEQWRQERQERRELIELSESLINDAESLKVKLEDDLKGSAQWIRDLDTIHVQRMSNHVSEPQLNWLYELISGHELFLFSPQSPSYMSAANSGLLEKLPDSIQNNIYVLYHDELLYFQLLYDQQQENITHFRNTVLMPSQIDLYDNSARKLQVDLKKFAHEVQSPLYGNFILEMRTLEKRVYGINENASAALVKLINSLRAYRDALKT
jgi:uncharacterized protein YjiS (DUF1127 family)